MYPYDVNPNLFIQQALQPVQPQVQPYFPSVAMPTAPQYYGPTHQALSQSVQGLLGQKTVLNILEENNVFSNVVLGNLSFKRKMSSISL